MCIYIYLNIYMCVYVYTEQRLFQPRQLGLAGSFSAAPAQLSSAQLSLTDPRGPLKQGKHDYTTDSSCHASL